MVALAAAGPAFAGPADSLPWWIWPALLFAVSFAIGIVGVLGGVGGGVLFVPIVSGFFPFHLDFVRAAGLLLALSGALSAAPSLMRNGMASLRLAIPLGMIGSVTSIAGAWIGLAMPAGVAQTALGATILAVVVLMLWSGRSESPRVSKQDRMSAFLALAGAFHDPASRQDIVWRVHRLPAGLLAFAVIGLIGGMFGLGAGWANVPALNLLMGAPLKLAVGTSGLVLSICNSTAAWVYINEGAVLPIVVAPSIIGVMLGAKIGARLLRVVHAETVRRLVIVLLVIAGGRALLKGLGIWT